MSQALADGSKFFTQLVLGYRSAKVVFVANRLGVFEHLAHGSLSAPELADRLAVDPRMLELLLRALVALELLGVTDDLFGNLPLAAEFLVPGRPMYAGNNLRFVDMLWDNWSQLEAVVRTGAPGRSLMTLLGEEGQEFTGEYIRGMIPLAVRPAGVIAQILGDRPLKRMIDVGCGPGAYAAALLDRLPELTVTLFDLASTLVVTREVFAANAHSARAEFRAGNYLTDDYGEGYDLAFLSHTTHDESPRSVENMLRRALRSLEPGGRVAIHDFVVDDATRARPAWAALFSVNLAVYTEGGQVYSVREYSEMLARVGFVDVTCHPILEGAVGNPTALIVATKPA